MLNLIYGFHAVSALIKHNPTLIELVYLANLRQDERLNQLLQQLHQQQIQVELVNVQKLNQLTTNACHQGVVAVMKQAASLNQTLNLKQLLSKLADVTSATLVVLDGITDPHNLGAIIRSCDCFGVAGLIIPKDNSAGINPTVAKTAAGAISYLPIVVVNNLARSLEELKEHGYWIAGTALSATAIDLFDFAPAPKNVWVMGSESKGMRRLVTENCDYLVRIPMYGHTQSLNVSVAAGVVLAYTCYQNKIK